MIFIAEVKTKSPYGYRSPYEFEELLAKAQRVGHVIAIHTDERWGGSYPLLRDVCRRDDITKPILAKGIHWGENDATKALDMGATWALKVGSYGSGAMPMHPQIWQEPLHSQWEYGNGASMLVFNARNLTDGSMNMDLWDRARTVAKGKLIQASGIKNPDDVKPDADGFIVGEGLMSWPE